MICGCSDMMDSSSLAPITVSARIYFLFPFRSTIVEVEAFKKSVLFDLPRTLMQRLASVI